MVPKHLRLIPALFSVALLMSSCGQQQQAPQQQSYKDTKSMVLDVLKTEEAQQALQEASEAQKDQTMRLLSSKEGMQVQLAIRDLFTTENYGIKMLEETMKDPKFAGQFAKAGQASLKEIEKDLLKDPEYQKNLFEAFNNPDFQKIILQTMKSQQYRTYMKEIVKDSLASPLFREELITMFEKAVREEMKKQDKTITISPDEGGSKGGGGGSGGGGSEGEQSSEGGSGGGSEGSGEGGGEGGGSGGQEKQS